MDEVAAGRGLDPGDVASDTRRAAGDVAGAIAKFAVAQGGLVTLAQCVAAGLDPRAAEWRVTSRRWQRLQRGVYLTHSGPVDWAARAGAAVLACGRHAVLSHASAAYLYELLREPGDDIHVIVPFANRTHGAPGLRVHRVADRGVNNRPWPPRTGVADTILDAGRGSSLDDLVAMATKACSRKLTDAKQIAEALRARGQYPNRELLRIALGDVEEGAESLLEIRYIRQVEQRHGLPKASRQARSGKRGNRIRRDFEFPDFKVIVEVDGRIWHEGAFASDRKRDRQGTVGGWLTLRYTWAEIAGDPCGVAAEIAAVLRMRGWRGSFRRCGRSCSAGRLL